MTDLDMTSKCLYRLHYRCSDACQDPGDPYGRSPDHRCHEILALGITKTTAKRIYFTDGYRDYYVERAAFGTDGNVYHRRLCALLYLDPPELLPGGQVRTPKPSLSELRAEMANAHPDRGGRAEDFIAARDRFVRARQAGGAA